MLSTHKMKTYMSNALSYSIIRYINIDDKVYEFEDAEDIKFNIRLCGYIKNDLFDEYFLETCPCCQVNNYIHRKMYGVGGRFSCNFCIINMAMENKIVKRNKSCLSSYANRNMLGVLKDLILCDDWYKTKGYKILNLMLIESWMEMR